MNNSNVDAYIVLTTKKKSNRIDSLKKAFKRDWQLILIGLPSVIILFLFSYLPMTGIIYAFQKVG